MKIRIIEDTDKMYRLQRYDNGFDMWQDIVVFLEYEHINKFLMGMRYILRLDKSREEISREIVRVLDEEDIE